MCENTIPECTNASNCKVLKRIDREVGTDKTKPFITTELREPPEAVFIDKYPEGYDVVGWLEIYSGDWLFGNIARKSLARIR